MEIVEIDGEEIKQVSGFIKREQKQQNHIEVIREEIEKNQGSP